MKNIFPYLIIVLLAVLLVRSVTSPREVVVESRTVDTLTVVRIDTVRDTLTRFLSEVVLDTIVIEKVADSVLKLPMTQRYYASDDYQAWVSGYRPRLDSINVFAKVRENTVTNTVTREVYPRTTDFFVNAGGSFQGGSFMPFVGASVKFRNDMTIGGHIGYGDSDVLYGFSIGFKLNNRRR